MASDDDFLWSDFVKASEYDPADKQDDSVGWFDPVKNAAASVVGQVALPFSAGQAATAQSNPNASDLMGGLSMIAHGASQAIENTITPGGRRARDAAVFPDADQASIFSHPIGSAFMKASGLAGPAAVLAIAPEGFLAQSLAGGVTSSMQVADEAANYINSRTDEQLTKDTPLFKQYIDAGVDPAQARRDLLSATTKGADVIVNGVAGALGYGAGGKLLKGGASGAAGGAATRALTGAAEAGGGMGVMGAAGELTSESADITRGNQTGYDVRKILGKGLNDALEGAAFGGTMGVIHKPDGRRVRIDDTPQIERVGPGSVPNEEQTAALTADQAPKIPEAPDQAKPGSEPTETPSLPAEVTPPPAEAPQATQEEASLPQATPVAETPPEAAPEAPVKADTVSQTTAEPEQPAAPVEATPQAPTEASPPEPLMSDVHQAMQQTRQPRVLRDETVPDVTYKPPGLEEGPRWGEGGESQGRHWNNEQKAQRQTNADVSKRVFEENTSGDQKPVANAADKEAFRQRLEKAVNDALEGGVRAFDENGKPEKRIPKRVGYDKTPDHMVWLAESQRLLNKLNSKSQPSYSDLNQHLALEHALREGDASPLREKRKEEGDLKNKRSGGDVEQMDGGAKAGNSAKPDDAAQTKVGKGYTLDPTAKERTASAPRKIELTAEQKQAALDALNKASAKRVPKENELPEIAAAPRSKDARDWHVHLTNVSREAQNAKDRADNTITNHTTGESIVAQPQGTLKEALAKHVTQWGEKSTQPGLNRILFPQFKNLVQRLAGNVKVHSVSSEQMKALQRGRLAPEAQAHMGDGTIAAYYDHTERRVVIDHDLFNDPQQGAQLLVHEGVHAALDAAAAKDPAVNVALDRMRAHVKAYMRAWEEKTGNALGDTYGLINNREFMTEAFSNPEFQNILARIDAPADIVKALGMDAPRKMTMWDVFVNSVRKFLGMPKGMHSMLEAAMRTGQYLGARVENERAQTTGAHAIEAAPRQAHLFEETFADGIKRGSKELTDKLVSDPATHIMDGLSRIYNNPDRGATLASIGRKFVSNDQLRQAKEWLFPDAGTAQNVLRRITDLQNKQGVAGNALHQKGMDLNGELIKAQKMLPGAFDKFSQLLMDETRIGVAANEEIGQGRNGYLRYSKDVQNKLDKGATWDDIAHEVNMNHVEAHERHPELQKRYDELVAQHPGFAELHERVLKYFEESQDAMALGHIQKVLNAVKDKSTTQDEVNARADELHKARITDELKNELDKQYGEGVRQEIIKAKQLSGKNGPYIPLMRHGDYVVQGRYKVEQPSNATKVNDNTFEFKTRKEAVSFARKNKLHHEIETAYFDPATGERTTKEGGISTAGSAEQRFQVTLQRKHVSFHESKRDALEAHAALKESGIMDELKDAQRRREIEGHSSELTSAGMDTILRKLEQQPDYLKASKSQQAEMRKALSEASLSMQAGNRIQSRRLPRRYVEGASNDLTRNFAEYNSSQANYRAKMEYRPQIEQAISDMWDQVKSHNPYDGNQTHRSEIAHEFESRARAQDPSEYTGKYTEWARRFAMYSYIDRMARASHLLLHQMHLPMITAPAIAARHGAFKAYAEIAKAWKDAFGVYREGAQDAYNSLTDALHKGTDFNTFMKNAFGKAPDGGRIAKMIDHFTDIGLLHPEAGLEVHKYMQSKQLKGIGGVLDNALSRVDTTFRHLTNSTEAINRYVGAVAAYRLEYAKLTRDGVGTAEAHEKAIEYARNTVANTEGLYTSSNAAPIFKNKILRPFLQFRQFPQMIYHLLAKNTIQMFKGATKEEKMEGFRVVRNLLLTHTMMTGVLGGLPLEGPKVALTIANALGISNSDWSDFERWEYDQAVKHLGKEGADWVMHGLSRMGGFDAHHRLGLNSFFTFGMPSHGSSGDWWAFLAQQAAGAPGGLVADNLKGAQQVMSGDIGKGLATMYPLQAMRDIQKAYTGQSGDYDYSPAERATRLLGFTPSAEAEHYERKAETKSLVKQYNTERGSLTYKWIDADGSDKQRVWAKIQKWNEGKPKDAQITLKQLTDAAKRRKKDEDDDNIVNGVRLNKRTKFIGDRANAVY